MTETPMVDLRQLNVAHDEIADLRRQLTAAQAKRDGLQASAVAFQKRALKAEAELVTARETIKLAVRLKLQAQDALDVTRKDTERLRELLWMAWSNGMGYGDDGELQFAGMDFKRDSLELLERKMYERNLPAVKAFLEARDREEPAVVRSEYCEESMPFNVNEGDQ